MIIYIDIDETICEYVGERRYELAVPRFECIDKINSLYDQGHTITYWTARGGSQRENEERMANLYDLTKLQLGGWGAKYHDLLLTKPIYDILIDDKSFNSVDQFFNMCQIFKGKK